MVAPHQEWARGANPPQLTSSLSTLPPTPSIPSSLANEMIPQIYHYGPPIAPLNLGVGMNSPDSHPPPPVPVIDPILMSSPRPHISFSTVLPLPGASQVTSPPKPQQNETIQLDPMALFVLKHATTEQLIHASSQGLKLANGDQLKRASNESYIQLDGQCNGLRECFDKLTHLSRGPSKYTWTKALRREDYPLVTIWTEAEYREAGSVDSQSGEEASVKQRKKALKGKNPDLNSKHRALVHFLKEDGSFVTEAEGRAITERAHALFFELQQLKIHPDKWHKAINSALRLYREGMYDEFPHLFVCEGHWKVDRIATMEYSAWYNTYAKHDHTYIKLEIKCEHSSPPIPAGPVHATSATKRRLTATSDALTGGLLKKQKTASNGSESPSNTETTVSAGNSADHEDDSETGAPVIKKTTDSQPTPEAETPSDKVAACSVQQPPISTAKEDPKINDECTASSSEPVTTDTLVITNPLQLFIPAIPSDEGTGTAPLQSPAPAIKPTKGKKVNNSNAKQGPGRPAKGKAKAKDSVPSTGDKTGEDLFGALYLSMDAKATKKKIATLYKQLHPDKRSQFESDALAASKEIGKSAMGTEDAVQAEPVLPGRRSRSQRVPK